MCVGILTSVVLADSQFVERLEDKCKFCRSFFQRFSLVPQSFHTNTKLLLNLNPLMMACNEFLEILCFPTETLSDNSVFLIPA